MDYKAKVSFSGIISMEKGQVSSIADPTIAKDLLRAGYITEIKPATKSKATSNKRPTRTKKSGDK